MSDEPFANLGKRYLERVSRRRVLTLEDEELIISLLRPDDRQRVVFAIDEEVYDDDYLEHWTEYNA